MREHYRALGAYLRRAREAQGLTKSGAGAAVGVSHTTIARIEGGRYKTPNMELLRALAHVYAVDYREVWRQAGLISADEAAALDRASEQLSAEDLIRRGLALGNFRREIKLAVHTLLGLSRAAGQADEHAGPG